MSWSVKIGRRLTRILALVTRLLEEWIPSFLLACSVILLCLDVVGRYVFNHPIPGAPALATVCFIWVTYLGAAAISRRSRHIVIDVFVDRLPPRAQAAVQLVVQALIVVVLGYVLFFTWDALLHTRFVEIPGVGISRSFVTLSVLVGFALMAMYAVRDLAAAGRGVIQGGFTLSRPHDDEGFGTFDASAPVRTGYEPPGEVTEAIFIKDVEKRRPRGGEQS